MPKMLKMDPNLMRPATVQPAFEQARLASTAYYFEIRSRFSPALARDCHFFAMNPMTRDGGNNCSRLGTYLSGNKRKINLVDRAGGELSRNLQMGKIILCHRQAAACFLVKPMHNPRSLFAADAGKIFAMRKQGINQCAAFPSCARMNRNSRRFVYNNQVVIFEQNGERDLLRDQINRLKRWFDQDNAIARSHNVACTPHCAVDCDEPVADQRLDSRTRKLIRRVGEKTVQPRARIRFFNDKLAAVLLCH